MDRSLLKLIRSNIIFILCFSFIFSTYCLTASYIFDRAKCYSENTEADRTISERLIVIDPGHGGEDGGAVGINGVYEKELNLDISEALATYLRFAGFEVVQTRTEDVLLYDRNVNYKGRKKVLDLAARLNIAEELMPDLFISIHMNAFPDSRYSGLTVYYSPNNEVSYEIADRVRQDIIDAVQPNNNRELKKAGSNIYLLNRMSCPSILVECGFLSNESECNALSTDEYRHKLSLVFLSSISSFFHE